MWKKGELQNKKPVTLVGSGPAFHQTYTDVSESGSLATAKNSATTKPQAIY